MVRLHYDVSVEIGNNNPTEERIERIRSLIEHDLPPTRYLGIRVIYEDDTVDQYRYALGEIVACSDEVLDALDLDDLQEAAIRLRVCADMARGLLEVEG